MTERHALRSWQRWDRSPSSRRTFAIDRTNRSTGDNLYSLIAKKYRFSDRREKEVADEILRMIQEGNGLTGTFLKAGQTLKLPPLPTRPLDKGASARLHNS